LKLINLLNNFIFNKSILFNILKKIKLFNNILTLNFISVYSSQNNSIFKNSILIQLNKFSIINLNKLIINNQINNIKLKQIPNTETKQLYLNFLKNMFAKHVTLSELKFMLKNLNPNLINFIKINNLKQEFELLISIFSSTVTMNYNIITQFYSNFNSFNFIDAFNDFKFNELNIKFKNFNILQQKWLFNKNKLNNKLKLIQVDKSLVNFQILKLSLVDAKNLLSRNFLKILSISKVITKLKKKKLKLNYINFNFYNEVNVNYNKLLVLNQKLKNFL
jgi:hypothetical protein